MQRDELADWLRLALAPGVGLASARKLLAAFGLPGEVLTQSAARLGEVVSAAQAKALTTQPASEDVAAQIESTWQWLQGDGGASALPGSARDSGYRRIVTLGDAAYPASLLQMADPPLLLYLVGAPAFELTQLADSVAIVGSRNPTHQGLENARAFGKALAAAGRPVISGLALGIDGAAHQGALDGVGEAQQQSLATVAIVGTGLDRVYPSRHRALAHAIAERGLIVSEFPLGTPPLAQNFPMRNRIIAGLSRGTLVVEAALASGSLVTARLAVEQGKEVFAIPGSIHSPQSRGCHALLRQGAKLVESVQDVLEELAVAPAPWIAEGAAGVGGEAASAAASASASAFASPSASASTAAPAPASNACATASPAPGESTSAAPPPPTSRSAPRAERKTKDVASLRENSAPSDPLLEALGYEPAHLDALVARTGWSAAQLQVRLLDLELDGHIARLPGGLFQRVARG